MKASTKKEQDKKGSEFVPGKTTNRCKSCFGWFKEKRKTCPFCGSSDIDARPYIKATIPY